MLRIYIDMQHAYKTVGNSLKFPFIPIETLRIYDYKYFPYIEFRIFERISSFMINVYRKFIATFAVHVNVNMNELKYLFSKPQRDDGWNGYVFPACVLFEFNFQLTGWNFYKIQTILDTSEHVYIANMKYDRIIENKSNWYLQLNCILATYANRCALIALYAMYDMFVCWVFNRILCKSNSSVFPNP